MNLVLIAATIRQLGNIAPLLGAPGVTVIANTIAGLIEVGSDATEKMRALTAEMKAREEAGVTTTAEEILADIERIKDLDRQIQETAPTPGDPPP